MNWSQYKLLIRINDADKRTYYIEETCKNNWSFRQLERQINSQLYERLLLSTNKEKVLAVAKGEAKPENRKEIIKDPMVLEFLGLKQQAEYYEKDLEQAIITNIQHFLLELGNGFSFVARQKRLQLQDVENPTIGILLCTDKNNVVVELVLPDNNNTILASKYQLYLHTKEQILKQVEGFSKK